ncbi:LPD38 domain-containing protein [Vreelandella venusta]|uniref:LPD38 domain-containing protein n=1 Tax=Vreelandella venusta TaxID=44935 RepID=UPI0018DAA01B|nr:LPD38 domain-containing protein [Halomonas venusta]QPI65949.1 hypothetical protein IR195_09730 [Halomonas venusta]
MNAAEQPQPLPWKAVSEHPAFQSADWKTRQKMRNNYVDRVVRPLAKSSEDFARVRDQFFTRTEADVFGGRENQPSADGSQPATPNLASNALRNAGERGLDLAGNALQFVGNVADRGEQAITDALGGINPGVIGGSVDEMRERGYEPDITLGGFGLDFTMRAKPEDTSTGLIDTGQAVEDISLGYQPNYTIDRALDEPSIKTIAGAAAEQGPAALADMAGLVVNLPAYLAARTQEIGEGRVENDNREGMPVGRDYAVSGPTAAASVLLDRFALGRLLPGGKNAVASARQIPGAVGRAAATESVTEAIQEGGIEYAGESVGTETGWDATTAERRAAGGVIVGGPTGGAVRAGTAAMEMRGNNQQGSEQPEPSESPTEQSSPAPEEAPTPEAETANAEAVGTAAELIAKPRFELSSAERDVRDSISYGDAFKALRTTAEERGDNDAVAEMDAISSEISAALEAETIARSRNDSDALMPVREQLQSVSERFTRVMDRLNSTDNNNGAQEQVAGLDMGAQRRWEEAWREQAAQDGIADYDPNADLPDKTVTINGEQVADESLAPPVAPDATRQDEQAEEVAQEPEQSEEAQPEPVLPPSQPSPNPDSKTPRRVPVESIQVDPQAYQFRTEVNEQGVDSRLEGIEKWDDIRAGNLILHERSDGSVYAADGHHRINLARQLQQPDVNAIVLREADGVTVDDARRAAAEANIAAGSATAMDAAKVFRNSEGDIDTVIRESNLPRTQLVRDGANIAKLDTEPFGAVLNKVIAEKDGAVIGRSFTDPDQQMAAVSVFHRVKPTNDNQRELLANEVRQAGFADSRGEQGGLFGDDPAESLMGERVKVMDNLRQTLVRDKRLFATLNDNAQTAEQAGNRIAKDRNSALQETSVEAIALLERATTTPEINQKINDAARRVKDGEALASVTRELKEALLNGTNSPATSEGYTPAPSSGQTDQAGQNIGRSKPVPAVNDARTTRAREQHLLTGAGTQAEPAVTLKTDGKPFQTRKAVELSKRFRDTPNAQPVEINGGWGFFVQNAAQKAANTATNEHKAAQPLKDVDKGQSQTVNWQRRSKNSKVWNGSNGMVIADHGFSIGGNRTPMFMVFKNRDAFDKGIQLATKDTLREAKQFAVTTERPTTQQSDNLTLGTQTEESFAQREQEVQQAGTQQRQGDVQRAQAAELPAAAKKQKPTKLTPRQQLASNAFGGAIVGDTIKLATDVGYAKAGSSYTVDSLNKDGTLQATNVERGSSVLISQGEWTQASRRTKAPIAEVTKAEQESGQSNQEAMYSLRSVVRGDGKEQGVKLEEAQRIADEFMADYNGNIPLDLMVVNRQEDAYGPAATRENVGVIKGAYHSGSGKLVLAAASLRDARDGRKTLRHEVVGHYGLNTFEPKVKRQILDRVLETQEVPSLRPAWDHVNQHYPADSTSADVRAEEVFAHLAERERGRFGAAWDGVLSQLNRAMRQAGLTKHPLSRAELHDLASTISKEIREDRRQQRTFPDSDQDSFNREQSAANESPQPTNTNASSERAEAERLFSQQGYSLSPEPRTPNAVPIRSEIEASIRDMPEMAGTKVIQSAAELPPSALMGMVFRGVNPADVRGMFIGDELYVIADNVDSVEDGIRTAVHEAVGHKGIRGVLGAELETVMRQVYNTLPLDPRGREALKEVLESYPFLDQSNPEHQITIAEEMVAHLTEKGWQPNVLRRAVARIRELLRRYFPSINWTDTDVMQLSERSREYLRREQQAIDSESDSALFSLENHGPESTAWQRAEAKGLDMSQKGRMQRARDMGYIASIDEAITAEMGNDGKVERRTTNEGGFTGGDGSNPGGRVALTFYHGTRGDVEAFVPGHQDRLDSGWLGKGVYLTTDQGVAKHYAEKKAQRNGEKAGVGGEVIMPLHIRPNSLLRVPPNFKQQLSTKSPEISAKFAEQAKEQGFDGVVTQYGDAYEIALFDPSQIRSTQAAFDPDGVDSNDLLFSLSPTPGGNFDNDSTNFALPDESLKQTALRKMADKMNRLKVTQEVIKKAGGNINEDNDVYLAEELFHGKTERDLNELSRNYVEKLAKGMAARGIQQEELDAYLYARHAPERNARIAERNPDDPRYADGGSGMTNAEAAAIMQEAESSGKKLRLERLAAIVDDMLAHRREIIREGGLESDETLDAWDASYDYYVPLKGWANDEDVPVGQDGSGRMRSGRGYEIGGRETKTALGRLSKAASPSTQAIVDTTESMIRKRKNEVGNALLSLITDNPNPDLWQVFTNNDPDTQRTQVERTNPDGTKRIEVEERPVAMEMNERYFKTKKAGRTYYIKINDQRLLNAMRNVGPEQNNLLVRTAASGTRALSAMMTSYNPEFMLTNFTRDVQTALLNVAAEQTRDDGKIKGEKIARQTARDIPRAMKAAYRGLADPDAPRNTEWDRWFDEFIEDGAKTGYFDMKDLAGQAKEIKSIIGRENGGTMGNMLKAKKTVADFVENMNGSVENAVRLSAYVNARRAGISRKKAASLAKNLTVNFNRRGEAGTALNAAYMFANASIQGTMNVARTMATVKDTPVGGNRMNIWGRMNAAQKLAVGMAVGSYAMAMFNRMMSDEDDDGELFYDKIPGHVKERNLIIMTGGKDYVRIPLPYGYNVFSNIGTHAESVMSGKSSLTEAGKDMTLAILGSFSPIGFQDSEDTSNLVMKNLTPTLLGSVTQVAVNEDFAGRVIFKENFPFGTPKPDSSLAFRSTPSAYQSFAQFINELTGGSEYRSGGVDVSPDVLQHVVNYYGGGAWSFTEKVADSIKRTATGETIDAHRIPFVGRFKSEVNEYGDIQTFYERRTEVGQLHEEFINLPREEARSFYDEHGGKIALFDMAKDLEKTLTKLRKVRDAIEADERLTAEERDEQLDEIEDAMDSEVDFFNLLYNQAGEAVQ